jgi:RND family efflux transporter MFP subunit
MAQNDLGNTSVKAPFTGYVAELPVGRGQLVGPTVKVATLVQIDTLVAKLQVPEAEQSQLKTGLRVVAKVAAYPDRDFTGTLTSVDPSIDVAGRSITILVRIPNPGGILRPGMFASARVELPQSTKIVYVPLDAVVTQAGSASSSVFVVDGQSVTQKLVRLGDRDSRGVGIITGLDAGARVAVGNLTQLFDGAPVTVRNRS